MASIRNNAIAGVRDHEIAAAAVAFTALCEELTLAVKWGVAELHKESATQESFTEEGIRPWCQDCGGETFDGHICERPRAVLTDQEALALLNVIKVGRRPSHSNLQSATA